MYKFAKYALRWQLSTPILAVCITLLPGGALTQTIIANTIGAAIFFHVDQHIFTHNIHPTQNEM